MSKNKVGKGRKGKGRKGKEENELAFSPIRGGTEGLSEKNHFLHTC